MQSTNIHFIFTFTAPFHDQPDAEASDTCVSAAHALMAHARAARAVATSSTPAAPSQL